MGKAYPPPPHPWLSYVCALNLDYVYMYFIKVIYVIEKVSYNAFNLFEYFSQLWAPFNFEWFLLVFLSIFLDRYLNCYFWLISVLQMFTDFYCRRGFVLSLPLPLVISLFAYFLCPSKVMSFGSVTPVVMLLWPHTGCVQLTHMVHYDHVPFPDELPGITYVNILFRLLFLWICHWVGIQTPFQYVSIRQQSTELIFLGNLSPGASQLAAPAWVSVFEDLPGSHEMLLLWSMVDPPLLGSLVFLYLIEKFFEPACHT